MRRTFPVVLSACAVFLAGCASSAAPLPQAAPLSGPKAEAVSTSYSEALRCLSSHVRSQTFAPPRVAVGLITDMTGAQDRDNGRRLTQGATLMAITALSESGVRLVERFDMGVLQVEMDYARNGLLRDSDSVLREVRRGEVQGSDLYLIGGISEYNPNIRSRGIDGFGSGDSSRSAALTFGASDYVVDVAVDLRLVDTRSSEVLGVRSLRKQVVGREIRAGVFAFLDGTVVDIGGGQRAMEPVQTAVRAMVDQSVFEFISSLYSFDTKTCVDPGFASDRPVAGDRLGRGQLSPELAAPDLRRRSISPSAGPTGGAISSISPSPEMRRSRPTL
jgi:curli production assembly/transport component CsgG/holdfast attachment protein HfaB